MIQGIQNRFYCCFDIREVDDPTEGRIQIPGHIDAYAKRVAGDVGLRGEYQMRLRHDVHVDRAVELLAAAGSSEELLRGLE